MEATEYETSWNAEVTAHQAERRPLTPDEQAIIDFVEARKKRKLTRQEINLSLLQAAMIGEL